MELALGQVQHTIVCTVEMRVVLLMFGRIKKPSSPLVVGALLLLGFLGGGIPVAYGVTNLVWSDEFDGSSSNVDVTKWSFDLGNSSSIAGGGWGNNEKQVYTARTNNAFVSGGLLHVKALNDQGGSTPTTPYSSARLHTRGKFSINYGRVEFRAKLPSPSGYWWPALWMLATNYSDGANGIANTWPRCGEIDVMENKRGTNQVLGTIHKDSAGSPGVNAPVSGTFTFPSGDSVTNFHTYVLLWSSNSISFAIDSNAAYKVNTSWSSSTGSFPAPFNHPFYIIMNLAIGGNFVGDPSVATINAATTFPGEMQIDYVRVYQDVLAPAPAILSVTPSNGCMSGGTAITVIGSNFVNGATVTIGGASATSVTFVNTNTLTAITPGNSAGLKNVVVNIAGSPSATLTNGFSYYGLPLFAGLGSATPAVEGATLTWSAASGAPPLTYDVYQGTESLGEDLLLQTNSLSAFVPLYPGSNSPITYFFIVEVIDGCGINDNNVNELTVVPLVDPALDQDSDGMSNGFEQQYGLNPFDAGDATADLDGDGLSNLQEFLIGTDPTDKTSPFHVIAIAREDNDLRITWADAAGRTNVVGTGSDVGGSFTNISPNIIVSGSGVGVTNYLDSGAVTNALPRLYKIRVVP